MKMYIWQRISYVSASYEGGLVISAPTLEEARRFVRDHLSEGCGALSQEPDCVLDLIGEHEVLYVFPDEASGGRLVMPLSGMRAKPAQ